MAENLDQKISALAEVETNQLSDTVPVLQSGNKRTTMQKIRDLFAGFFVAQEAGKGLSEEDYTTAEKTKLSGLNQLFLGQYVSLAALQIAYPTASPGNYAIVNPGSGVAAKQYIWDDEEGWVISSGTVVTSTDSVPEGTFNLYFTVARVLATVLTGLSLVTNAAITASDTVLSALGKLQKQITDLTTTVSGKVNTSDIINDLTHTDINKPLSANQGKVLKDTADALAVTVSTKMDKQLTLGAEITTSRALTSDDIGKHFEVNSASDVTLTVPAITGFQAVFSQKGAGRIVFAASGVTIKNLYGHTKSLAQDATVSIYMSDTNIYRLKGETGA